MSTKGKFLVIDGTDGSGKQTQAKLLVERLRTAGRAVETISFPQYGKRSCGPVEEYLAGKYGQASEVPPRVASLFYAIDRYDAGHQIRAWLEAGAVVVADRFVSSNMAHQGGKISSPAERTAFLQWEEEMEYGLLNLPRPDLTVILHVPTAISQKLLKQRDAVQDIHQRDIRHLQDAEAAYLEIARTFPQYRLIECVKDDELMTREQIHELLWQQIQDLLAA
jgi:dTMP kinase